MDANVYHVANYGGQWHVDFGESRYGPFRNQDEAIAGAKGWASINQPSRVEVREDEGKVRTVWTSDDDSLPLRY